MHTVERFHRPEEYAREPRVLAAPSYNAARLLQRQAPEGHVFVPLRTLQVLAIVDAEEIVFVDGFEPRCIELAWQRFRPQARSALDQPVPYEAVYYHPNAAQRMARLVSEFGAAVRAQRQKRLGKRDAVSAVVPWPRI